MKDTWHKMVKWMDYNRWLFATAVLAVVLAVGLSGCEPFTISPMDPERMITALELQMQTAEQAGMFEEQVLALDANDPFFDRKLAMIEVKAKTYKEKANIAAADLEAKRTLRLTVANTIGDAVQPIAETVPYGGAIFGGVMTLVTALIGFGAIKNGRRKDTVIEGLKADNAPA